MEGVVNEGADVVEDHADTGRPAGSDEEELLSESGGAMRCDTARCCVISGSVVAVVAAVLAFTFPLLYHSILNQQLSLQPGTVTYNAWLKAPVPLYIRFYLFNVTNAEQVLHNQTKPVLQQLGPYTFEERHERVNIERFDNFTIKFQQRRTWHFIAEMSNGTLSDNVTTLNVPVVGAAYSLRFSTVWFKVMFNRILRLLRCKLFVTKTSGQLLFEGYEDPLLSFASKFPPGIFPPFDKFGWFYQRNASDWYDGVFNIFTGVDDVGKVAVMDMWNGTRKTKYFEGHCAMVNGSFGEGWPPRRDRSSISLYLTDICRTLTLDYVEDVEDGLVQSYRFAGSQRTFANTSENADNWCFATGGVNNPSGIFNASTCRYGAPAFISFPHYYLADPYYLDQVEGLEPDQDRHQFHIDLEPEMSVPSSVRARLQIAMLIEPDPDIDVVGSDHVKRAFLPLIWFEICADLPDSLATMLNLSLQLPVIGTVILFAILCASLVSVAVFAVILVRRRSRIHVWHSSPTQPSDEDDPQERWRSGE